MNESSRKLFKINTRDLSKVKNYTTTEEFAPQKLFSLCIYDVEHEKRKEIDFNLRIVKSLKGFTELSYNNSLYLCGNPDENDCTSTFLFRLNPHRKEKFFEILVSPSNNHFYPSMLGLDDSILVVGGKGSKTCELYSIKNNKWEFKPDLPDERYGCSLISDNKNEYIYLIGGLNNDKLSEVILRINTQFFIKWETIYIAENSQLLRRKNPLFWFGNQNENELFILGGKDIDDSYIKNLVVVNIKNKKIESVNEKKIVSQLLNFDCSFSNKNVDKLNQNTYVFIDDEFDVIKVDCNSNIPIIKIKKFSDIQMIE